MSGAPATGSTVRRCWGSTSSSSSPSEWPSSASAKRTRLALPPATASRGGGTSPATSSINTECAPGPRCPGGWREAEPPRSQRRHSSAALPLCECTGSAWAATLTMMALSLHRAQRVLLPSNAARACLRCVEGGGQVQVGKGIRICRRCSFRGRTNSFKAEVLPPPPSLSCAGTHCLQVFRCGLAAWRCRTSCNCMHICGMRTQIAAW